MQSFLGLALGLWLLAAPVTFGYTSLNDTLCGLLLLIWGLLASRTQHSWLRWSIVPLGVWLQLAPLVFWAPSALIYANDTLSGMIAVVLGFSLHTTPSARLPRLSVATLALLCSCLARYMAVFQLGYRESVWDPFFPDGTLKVITSALSHRFPVSDAGLGALCYTMEFLLAWQGGEDRWRKMPWLVCSFAFLVIPVGVVSILLIIAQPLLVGAWCSWCLATALLMLPMMVLAAPECLATLRLLLASRRQGESVWRVFWQGK